MPDDPKTTPIGDSIPKAENEIAVGENLDFQRKWWKFEHAIWLFFLVILIADVLGLFGRGWLAKAQRTDANHTLTLDYERIERASTPSIMTLHFSPEAVHNGHIQLFISESIVKPLGAQRISPQPAISALSDGGITYTFDSTGGPTTAEISLSPSFPGPHHIRVQVPGSAPIEADVFVVP
jgi:hypothetical protein